MRVADLCMVRGRDRSGGLVVRVGVPLVDVYLEFLGGRCRPNRVLAAAYDLSNLAPVPCAETGRISDHHRDRGPVPV